MRRLTTALSLTTTMYPSLKLKELSVAFSEGIGGPLSAPTEVRHLQITIDKPRSTAPRAGVDSSAESPQDDGFPLPTYLTFDFIRSAAKSNKHELVCRPVKFTNSTMNKQMQEALKIINSHPEWTDAEMLEAAKERGLRFGPNRKQALIRLIPLSALAKLYGPLRLRKATFEIYGNAVKCQGCSFADLRWYVYAEEIGTPRTLYIMVEPFHGTITSMTEDLTYD